MRYLRKQPRQKRAQATVAAIVEAAARILAKDGFDRMTTNAVAERAGVSVGPLYQYFPNRLAIARALVVREIDRAEAVRPATLDDPSRSTAERVRAAVDWHFDVHAERPSLARAVHEIAASILPAEERRRIARLRSERTRRTIESLRTSDAVDLESAVFIVETCLASLADAAAARRPGREKPPPDALSGGFGREGFPGLRRVGSDGRQMASDLRLGVGTVEDPGVGDEGGVGVHGLVECDQGRFPGEALGGNAGEVARPLQRIGEFAPPLRGNATSVGRKC
jgi:AcrR family transcriptional regulator